MGSLRAHVARERVDGPAEYAADVISRRDRRGAVIARRTWPQRLLILLNVVVVFACLAAAGSFALFRQKAGQIPVVSVGVSLSPKVNNDEPRNYLIIGTDNSDGLPTNDPVRNGRGAGSQLADVIMVLRIDPKAQSAALLSIPRDTYVPISPSGRKSKINTAMSGPNGPRHLIDTIKENFGLSISQYISVDFEGFRGLVDVLGGVPVYISTPVRDANTGLLIPVAGCITLNPVQALAYARSRHFEYQRNGKWVSDGTGDLGRISRQQDFIRSAAQRAVDKGFRNPATALNLIEAATQAVTLDDSLSVGDLKSISDRFGTFNLDALQKYQLPTAGAGDSSFSYQTVITSAAEPMLDIFRGIVPGQPPAPQTVQVAVSGWGSGTAASAAVSSALFARNFDADADAGTPLAQAPGPSSVIRYGAKGVAAAALLARWVNGPVSFAADQTLAGLRLQLEVGGSFSGIRDQPADPSGIAPPPSSKAPSSTVLARVTTSASPTVSPTTSSPGPNGATIAGSSTTTTVIGEVPTDRAAAAKCAG